MQRPFAFPLRLQWRDPAAQARAGDTPPYEMRDSCSGGRRPEQPRKLTEGDLLVIDTASARMVRVPVNVLLLLNLLVSLIAAGSQQA